jgi:hypothetical protein
VAEHAIRLDDGQIVRDVGWQCEADVMASFTGFGVNRAYGALIKREHDDAPWQVVRPAPTTQKEA